jgi:glyoxylase I family protein
MARHSTSGVAGMAMRWTPSAERAPTKALATAGMALTQPASPAPLPHSSRSHRTLTDDRMRFFHTALSVRSIESSRIFYEKVFALQFNNEAERKEQNVKFVQLKDDFGNLLELFEHHNPLPLKEDLMDFSRVGIKHISFIVENIEQVISTAIANGGVLIRAPRAGKTVKRNAFIGDLDGIPVELVEL